MTHTDGHNGSGNIHTHIVINSVRKNTVKRESYMTQPHDHEAGYKHRSTNKFLNYFKKEIMDMCIQEGLHQVDLLSPAETKITQAEYMAQKSGQKKLEETNKKIIADGLETKCHNVSEEMQKQELRNAIEECSSHSKSFQEFQSLLFEKYQISVIEERGRYRYLHPDRNKRITEKALGTQYGKEHLEQLFLRKRSDNHSLCQITFTVGSRSSEKCESNAKSRICSSGKNIQSSRNGKYHYLCARTWIQYPNRIKKCLFRISKTVRSGNRSANENECRFETHQPSVDPLHRTIFFTESKSIPNF